MNCNSLKSFFRLWFYDVSRGYSLLMSVMPWLVAFLYCLKQAGNILYGMLALIGIVAAHLGTNVFDDFVDHLTGVPKQKCKTAYIDNGQTTVKKIFFVALFYFSIAALIGLFFTYKLGMPIVYLALAGAIICLLYPKLNFYCLGELALGLAFGPLLFMGVSYVMLEKIDVGCSLISIPASIVDSNNPLFFPLVKGSV